jgi:hypothetical protein
MKAAAALGLQTCPSVFFVNPTMIVFSDVVVLCCFQLRKIQRSKRNEEKKSDSGNADLSFACGVSSSIVPAATGVNPLVLLLLSKLSLCDANAPRY